jgi:hypothetical protein
MLFRHRTAGRSALRQPGQLPAPAPHDRRSGARLQRLVEDDTYCVDILTQIASVNRRSLGLPVLPRGRLALATWSRRLSAGTRRQVLAARSGGILHERDAQALVLEGMPLVVGEIPPAAVLALVLRGERQRVVDDKVAGHEREKLAFAAKRREAT